MSRHSFSSAKDHKGTELEKYAEQSCDAAIENLQLRLLLVAKLVTAAPDLSHQLARKLPLFSGVVRDAPQYPALAADLRLSRDSVL